MQLNHQMVFWAAGWLLHLTAFALVTFHSLQRRRNASATILWIFVAWSFPVIGPLIYLGFGVDRVGDRGYLKFLANQQLLEARRGTAQSAPKAYWHNLQAAPAENEFQRELNRALDGLLSDHPPLAGNRIVPLVSGDEAYPRMMEAIQNAEKHIHLQSFIIGRDSLSRDFMEALAAKAASGIEVRLLFDRFGSTRAFLTGLFRKYSRVPNFHIAGWTQANPLKRQFQINLRNHRKTLVVDGKTAFFGGINIHKENITRGKEKPIRDYHFQTEGPLVQELQYSFLRDWYFITGESSEILLSEIYFPAAEPIGKKIARLINTGPSSDMEISTETFFNSIILAKQQILAVTPYFVPPVDILRALRSAALRGVDVRLIVPQKNNHFYAGYASRALYEELLSAGVKIIERQPPFMHAKALVIDGEYALVGTANLDIRSLNLNYETCVAVYSREFADSMKEIIHEEIAVGSEIQLAEWRQRSRFQRFMENFSSLMTPVL